MENSFHLISVTIIAYFLEKYQSLNYKAKCYNLTTICISRKERHKRKAGEQLSSLFLCSESLSFSLLIFNRSHTGMVAE